MWIMNEAGWFICEVRGVCFLTWVSPQDKANAAIFPDKDISGWLKVLSRMSGENLSAVAPHV